MDLWGSTELGQFTRLTAIPNYYPLLEGIFAPSYEPPPGGGDFSTLGGVAADNASLVAYIAAQLAALVNAAPSQLDTLNELAAAIADDPNFASTMTALIAAKLSIANNLSDLANLVTARNNLSVYSKVQVDALIPVSYYRYGGFAVSNITASEILMDHVVTHAHTLAANFANSKASVGTNPAAAWVGDISKNGVSVGSLTISTLGVVTFTSTGGAAVAVAVGDVITLTAPAAADTTIARLRFTIEGTV